jgi:hypothetical protein
MNQDAVDDAEAEWMKAHTAANGASQKASEAWRRYSRTADGRPTEFKAAPKPPMSRQAHSDLLTSGLNYYEQQRKAKR